MKKGSTFTGRWRISMQTISFVIIGQIKKSWIKVLEHPLLHMIMLTTPILSPLQLSVIYRRVVTNVIQISTPSEKLCTFTVNYSLYNGHNDGKYEIQISWHHWPKIVHLAEN